MLKKIYKNHKETIHNFIWRALQIGGKQGVIFLIFILCAKLLNPYDFGIYNYVLAIIFFLIIFGDFGISTATSKFVAEYNAVDKEKLKYVLFNSGIIILGLTIILSILTILIGPWYLKERYVYILYLLPLIFLAPMTSLYDGIYRGLKKFKQLSITSMTVGILAIPMVYYLVKVHGLIGALIAQNIFYFVLLLALGFGYREFNLKINKQVIRSIGGYSLILGFISISYYLYTKVDIIILGHFGYIKEIGYYEIINKLYDLIKTPIFIISLVLSPSITSLYVKKDYINVRKKFINYSYYSLILGGILSIFLYFIIPLIIKNSLPQYFTPDSVYIFKILLFILPLRIIATMIGQSHTSSTGNAHYSLWTLFPAGVLNVFLDIFFIGRFGFVGVVYSTIICFTLAIVSLLILYYIQLNKLVKLGEHLK